MAKKKTREDYKEAIDKLDLSDIKNSMKVLKNALNSYPDLFTYCIEKGIKTNKLTIKKVVEKCKLTCEYLPEVYKNDIDFCSYIAKYNPRILKYCNPDFLEKEEIIRLALHNSEYYDTIDPEKSYRFTDIVCNLKPETLTSSEYKEKVMKIFFEEVDNNKIDSDSMYPKYYFDTKWLVDITVFNVIIDNCVSKAKEHKYDFRYSIFFENYLKDNKEELGTNELILNRITELLTGIDVRLKQLFSVKAFPEIIDLVYSILMDKDIVKDIKSVTYLRDIDKSLALKYEKKFRLNNNLDYQLLIGNDATILQSLSNAHITAKEICYILKNYPMYYENFEQYYIDYPEAQNYFSPYKITENLDLLDIVSNMPIQSFINFINAISKRDDTLKRLWFVTLQDNVNSVFAIYDSKIRTDKSTALKIINEIENNEIIYYYYWFLSEELKLDEEIALAAIHRNYNVKNILRKKILNNLNIIEEINYEKRNAEKQKELNELYEKEQRQAAISQKRSILNNEYIDFIKERDLPVHFQVDLFDLKNLNNIDVAIEVLEFLVITNKHYCSITMNENLFQKKEFFEQLSKNNYASKIFKEIKYRVDLEQLDIDPNEDVNLIDALLNKDILLPQCPASLIDSTEKAIHLLNALDYQIFVNTEWEPDEVILPIICQYPENDELLLKYCKVSYSKQPLIENNNLSKNKTVMKKILIDEEVQTSSLFRKLDEINHSIYEDEDFLSFYCEKFKNISKKVTFLPDIKNEELLKKYYCPLLKNLKDKLLLGSTLIKKYKKILNEKSEIESTKIDLSKEYKDTEKDYSIAFEVSLDVGESFIKKFYVDENIDILLDKLLVVKGLENEIYIGKVLKVRKKKDIYLPRLKILQMRELPVEFDENINKLRENKKLCDDSKEELNNARGVLEYIEDSIKLLEEEIDSLSFAFFGKKAKQKKSLIDKLIGFKESLEYYTKYIEELETKIKVSENEIQSSQNYIQTFKKNLVDNFNDTF